MKTSLLINGNGTSRYQNGYYKVLFIAKHICIETLEPKMKLYKEGVLIFRLSNIPILVNIAYTLVINNT